MAPEQVRGARVAKQNPFEGGSPYETMHRILCDEPPPLADAAVDRIVRRCLAKDRAARYREGVDPRQATRELDVAAVLVGKLRATGGTLLLDAELVRATDGAAIWSKRYARSADDVLALERDLAKDARRYGEALPVLSSLVEQFPGDTNAYAYLGFILSYLGRHDEALASIARAPATSNPNMELWNGILLARAGRTAEARAIADRADRAAAGRFLPVYYRAQLRAVLGERDAALSLLEKGKRNGEWLTWLRYDPGFDALRDDPRFTALLAAPYAAR